MLHPPVMRIKDRYVSNKLLRMGNCYWNRYEMSKNRDFYSKISQNDGECGTQIGSYNNKNSNQIDNNNVERNNNNSNNEKDNEW